MNNKQNQPVQAGQFERRVMLPCPFCGGMVKWCDCGNPNSGGCHQITCPVCGNFDLANGHLDGDGETMDDLRDCVAAKWNTRAA